MQNLQKYMMFVVVYLLIGASLNLNVGSDEPVLGQTIYVDDIAGSGPDNPPENFTSIQAAINAASDGDHIYVYKGLYRETVFVPEGKNNIDIIGEEKTNTIIDACQRPNTDAFFIHGGCDITISDLTIRNSSRDGLVIYANATAYPSSRNIVTNCLVMNHRGYGIKMYVDHANTSVDNNQVRDCEIYQNNKSGIFLSAEADTPTYARNNRVVDTLMYSNGDHGFELTGNQHTESTVIQGCTCYNNEGAGVFVDGSYVAGLQIGGSIFFHNADGIYLTSSQGFIGNCTVFNHTGLSLSSGLILDSASFVTVLNLNSFGNDYGIVLCSDAANNTITECHMTGNSECGLYANGSSHSFIFNNYFDNAVNARELSSTGNRWNRSKTLRENIVGGPYLGGNYWSDYDGTDIDGDGLGVTPYSIPTEGSYDEYPLVVPNASSPTIVYVDDDFDNSTPGWQVTHFDYIQDGVDAVLKDGTVFVFSGIYYEHIYVPKRITLLGENREETIIDGGGAENVIVISSEDTTEANGVTICNFTIRHSGNVFHDAGVYVASDYNIISNNNIINNGNFGIYFVQAYMNLAIGNNLSNNDNEGINNHFSCNNYIVYNSINSNNGSGINLKYESNNNTIMGNRIDGNHYGIYLLDSLYNNIIDNKICINNGSGIWITQSSRNHIAENEVNANEEHGIQITNSSNYNSIQENSISDNIQGIRFIESVFNTIQNNRICSNLDDGIALNEGSGLNRIIGNYIFNNVDDGIQIYHSSDNNITDNNITTNWERGIQITGDSYNNIIYHNNFFDNAAHGYDEMPNNWDNGYPSGGNYWDGYTGMDNYHGPNQDIPGPDGFIDIPYDISGGDNKDCYPLKDILKGSIPELPTKAHMGIIPSAETVLLGEKFTVTVYIDPIEEIGGWEVNQLNFTQGLVNAQDVIPGSSWNTIFDNGTINNENGEITGVQAWRTSLFPYTNHTACTVNYTTVQPGECDFALLDVTVTDSTFKEIDVITHDTAVNIITKPTIRNEYTENRSKGWGRGHNGYRPPYNLSAYVEDLDGDSLSITIQWYVPTHCYFKPDVNPCPEYEHRLVTVASFNGVGDGRYEFVPTGNSTLWFNDWVWGNTTYYWNICVTDGTFWANKTFWYHTGGSRYDVNNDGIVNFIDAGKVWVHRDSVTCYDGLYDVNQDCRVNFVDAGLTWVNRD